MSSVDLMFLLLGAGEIFAILNDLIRFLPALKRFANRKPNTTAKPHPTSKPKI